MKKIIAGYTAAPSDTEAAAVYYRKLTAVPEADGLEFAWNGAQSAAQLPGTLAFLPPTWQITINDIPGTFRTGVAQPAFGLASTDAAGRSDALAMAHRMNETVRELNDRASRRVVLAVEIHCAPGFDQRVYTANADALHRSLDEIAALTWDGCEIMLEHCDAFVAGQKPAKGFLTLEDEIDVLRRLAGAPVGLAVNWGRSLVELREPARVMEHVAAAAKSGLLRGFTFSGTAGMKNAFGEAWADSHLPFAQTRSGRFNEPASLMAMSDVQPVLPYLGGCVFLAIKTNWPAARTDPVERADSVIENFYTLLDEMAGGAV